MTQSSIWTKNIIKNIQQKGEEAKYQLRGFGANMPYPNLDDLLIVPAQVNKVAYDKYREKIDTKVVIGEDLKRPLELNVPIFIAAMSFGAISKNGKMAFAKGASQVGIATATGEGGRLKEEREICDKYGGKLIVQWSTGRFGVNMDYLKEADAVEIKLGQGAKPGMGGHLMAEKINDKIAETRGISEDTDALSPCRHLDMESAEDLGKHVKLLRELTNYEIPIIIKLGPGDIYEDTKIAIEAEPDAVAIDGGEGGTGCAPHIVAEHAGVPTLGIFEPAMKAFNDTGAKEKGIKFLVMGGLRNGADMYKALALGADACGIGTAAMVAIGCIGCQQCHTGTCPYGIATQDEEKVAKLDPEEAGDKLGNYLRATVDEIVSLTALSGHNNPDDVSKNDLIATNINASAITGVKLMGYDKPVTSWFEK